MARHDSASFQQTTEHQAVNGEEAMRVAVLGDGGWGTALAMLLHDNGHDVRVWGPFADHIEAIRADGCNQVYLPDVKLPAGLAWTADADEAAAGAELVVLASPSRYYRDVIERFAPLVADRALVVSVAKGLDERTRQRMSEVAGQTLGRRDVVALSGPSHAEEVARGIPTAVVAASLSAEAAQAVQAVFSGRRFRVYTSSDVVGVELGGALKNIVAVAVGVADGLGFGDNTRAALITRGLAEIGRLGCALGARPDTFAGLAGMGDLIVTATSRHSRNRRFGEQLGRGRSTQDILNDSKQVVEGVWNCSIAREAARERGVETPIADEVYAVAREGKPAAEAVESLLCRELKPESPPL
jgi:glycerol-3-phosphate dehydrogenase (NAD(P)+)